MQQMGKKKLLCDRVTLGDLGALRTSDQLGSTAYLYKMCCIIFLYFYNLLFFPFFTNISSSHQDTFVKFTAKFYYEQSLFRNDLFLTQNTQEL